MFRLTLVCSLVMGCGRFGYEDLSEGGVVRDGSTSDTAAAADADPTAIDATGGSFSTVLLVQKSGPPAWDVTSGPNLGGPFGVFDYEPVGPRLRFRVDVTGVVPNADYVLVQFNDPWPGAPAEDIATLTTDGSGDATLDWTEYELDRDLMSGEPKLWLVPRSHIDAAADMMTQFSAPEYLFEVDVLVYDDTDL